MPTTAVLTGADSIIVPSSGRYVDRGTVTVFTDAEWTSLSAVQATLFTVGTGGGSSGGPATIADGADVAQGGVGDSPWGGSGNSTVVAALKAIYAKTAATLGFSVGTGVMDATTMRVTVATDGPLVGNLGTTTDTGVTTDTNGTVSAKLRGLIILAAARWPVLGQALKAASVPVTLASDQGALVVSVNDGATLANNVASPDSGQGAQLVAGSNKEVSFTTTTAQAVASTDVKNYKTVSVQIVTQGGSSTVNFQASNDNTNWVTVVLTPSTSAGNVFASSGPTTTGIWWGPIGYRYFRLNVTGIVSGTTAGVVEFSALSSPANYSSLTVAQSGAFNVGSTPLPSATATGLTIFNSINLLAVATTVKASSGRWHKTFIYNPNASVTYLQVFNKLAGSVTLGTTVPDEVYPIPANGYMDDYWEASDNWATGITIAATTSASGNIAPGAGLIVNLGYI